MPLELRRCDTAAIPSHSPARPEPAGISEAELTDACLSALRRAGRWPASRVVLALPGLDLGASPEVSLRTAVRAASIYLRERDASILIAVPEESRFSMTDSLSASLAEYIAQRYTGAGGELFGSTFYRSPPVPPVSPSARPHASTFQKAFPDRAPNRTPARREMELLSQSLPAAPPPRLEDMLARTDAGFSETLLKLIDLSGRKDSEIYKRANIDRKLFSKIRSNPAYRPSKPTALALAFALELDLEATKDLLSRAGYTLTHASRADIIVEYFILSGNYDIFQLNETLFRFDQPILGGN